MVGMTIPMGEEFNRDLMNHESVRPIGMWRFLTPLETPQNGDLFRVIAGAKGRLISPYMNNWTVEDHDVDQPVCELPEYEYIRAIDDSSGFVPVFERPSNG